MWCPAIRSASRVRNGSLPVSRAPISAAKASGKSGARGSRIRGGRTTGNFGDRAQHVPQNSHSAPPRMYDSPMRPFSSARRWPSATSSTCARLRPVSTYAGMRPDAASTMMRPVGVGLMSRGPIGVEGLTITAGRPSPHQALDDTFGRYFAALVGADRLGFGQAARFVSGVFARARLQRGDGARVDDALDAGVAAAFHDRARAGHVVADDLVRIARPQPVIGGNMEDVTHAPPWRGASLSASRMSPSTISHRQLFEIAARAGGAHQRAHRNSRAPASSPHHSRAHEAGGAGHAEQCPVIDARPAGFAVAAGLSSAWRPSANCQLSSTGYAKSDLAAALQERHRDCRSARRCRTAASSRA